MKKLKSKVFYTIFIILTVFLFTIFAFNGIREYTREYNSVNDILKRENRPVPANNHFNNNINDDNMNPIFINYDVYRVILNDDGSIKKILNETNYTEEELKKIETRVNDIVNSHKEDLYVCNPVFENISYSFNNNRLVIVDSSSEQQVLSWYLLSSVALLVLLEILVFLIAKFLTKWIAEPVSESFEREKRFLADASHELKTPIAVIMASADAYENDKDKKWINNIKDESERMNKLVKELLDLTRLEKDTEIEKKEENLSKIIEKASLTYESLLYENKLELECNINKDIMFKCNSDSMKELMSILIDNAVKYSDKNGIVKVNLYNDNKDIVLEVINKGIPIKDEDKEKIFERFYKVDKSRNRKSNNYGLGLSIAKKIVELHNGSISASSKDGFTTFKIVFSQK